MLLNGPVWLMYLWNATEWIFGPPYVFILPMIGLHAGFGEMRLPRFQDVATLAKRRPRPGPAIAVGDYNIDMSIRDVRNSSDGVSAHACAAADSEGIVAVQTLADALSMRVRLLSRSHRGPGGSMSKSMGGPGLNEGPRRTGGQPELDRLGLGDYSWRRRCLEHRLHHGRLVGSAGWPRLDLRRN